MDKKRYTLNWLWLLKCQMLVNVGKYFLIYLPSVITIKTLGTSFRVLNFLLNKRYPAIPRAYPVFELGKLCVEAFRRARTMKDLLCWLQRKGKVNMSNCRLDSTGYVKWVHIVFRSLKIASFLWLLRLFLLCFVCLFVCLFHFQGKGRVMRMKGDGLAMGLLSKAIVDRSEGLKK